MVFHVQRNYVDKYYYLRINPLQITTIFEFLFYLLLNFQSNTGRKLYLILKASYFKMYKHK